jgi:predicted RNA-binding Zn-ribbon protein involved in translation (DUF1610 family)
VFVHIPIGVCTGDRDHTKAYFYCPTCRARKPCTQGTRARYFSLCFIPVVSFTPLGEYYRCEGCGNQFDPDARFPFDFGDHANPKLWTCSHCRSTNPSHVFQCQTCGWEG